MQLMGVFHMYMYVWTRSTPCSDYLVHPSPCVLEALYGSRRELTATGVGLPLANILTLRIITADGTSCSRQRNAL